jgi:hypothetical protein
MIAEVHLWDRSLPGYTVATVAGGFAALDSVCCGLVAWCVGSLTHTWRRKRGHETV